MELITYSKGVKVVVICESLDCRAEMYGLVTQMLLMVRVLIGGPCPLGLVNWPTAAIDSGSFDL